MKISGTQKQSKRRDFKELKYKYQLLRNLMDFIPDVIYFKDRKGRFIMVNQAHAKGLGVKPETLIGKTDFDIFPKERATRMVQDDERVMACGKPIIDKIERATRPDGVDNYVSTTKIPRYDHQGKVIGLIGITRDITRRMQFERMKRDKINIEKKLESLRELNAMKSEFVSTVSHELRTPLAIIKQLITLILNETVGKLKDKQKEVLVKVLENSDRLKKIIDDLLDISRIERNTLRLRYSLVDIVGLVKESSGFFTKLAEEKNIRLKYSYPKETINLFVDADRINQVIGNLISNAIKFTADGGEIKVEIKIFETKVRLGFIDTGIGIAKPELPLVFSKFTQLSKMPASENKGVGLGLAICKDLVEKHKGEIWVESKVGVGSRFYFTLPRFYTFDMLDKNIREKVSNLIKNGVSVYNITLLILNYTEFRHRFKIRAKTLLADLRVIIDTALKYEQEEKDAMVMVNAKLGKFSIVLPRVTDKLAVKISELLKYKIKDYFVKNTIEDVFITVGTLSYSQKIFSHGKGSSASQFSIKEIYIGSETRLCKRIPIKTTVKLFLVGGKIELCESVDISETGICLLTSQLLKTDMQVKLSIALPENEELIIVTKARVVWIKKNEPSLLKEANQYKVGLEFISLAPKYTKAIRGIVKRNFHKG